MSTVQNGATVSFHYTGTLADGSVFDSSKEGEPLVAGMGKQQLIVGLEEAMIGMAKDETKTVTIGPDKAYGGYNEDLLFEYPKAELPEDIEFEIGMQLTCDTEDGQTIPVTVSSLSDENVTLDANHPLSGKDLTFEVTVLEIKDEA